MQATAGDRMVVAAARVDGPMAELLLRTASADLTAISGHTVTLPR